MAAYPIMIEGLSPQELRDAARSYVVAQSSSTDAVLRHINQQGNRSYEDALRNLGREYVRYQREGNGVMQTQLIQAIGYFELLHQLETHQAAGDYQYQVSSFGDLNVAGKNRALELANAPDTATERAANRVISNNPAYRDEVAAALDTFIRQHPGASQNAIRNALDMEIYNNSGAWNAITQNVGAFFGGNNTRRSIVSDMRSVYEVMATGQVPESPRPNNPLVSSAQAATLNTNTRSVNEAINEILGTAGAGLMNPNRTDHNEVRRQAIAIVRRYQHLIHQDGPEGQRARDQVYGQLVRNWNNTTTGMANGYALDVLLRAVERESAHEAGQSLPNMTREQFVEKSQRYIEYARDPAAWRRAHNEQGGNSAAAGGNSAAGGSAAGAGSRARIYRFRGEAAPAANTIPVIDSNQVQPLQRMMADAGLDIGPTGADGKYGPKTHRALKDFAASLQPPITDLTQVDFTANNGQGDEEAQRIMQALQQRAQTRGTGQSAGPQAEVAPAATAGSTVQLTEAGQRLLAALTQNTGTSDGVMDLRTVQPGRDASEQDRTEAERLRRTASMDANPVRDGLLRSGIKDRYQLTDAQANSLQFVANGNALEVRSDFILSVERLLNSLSSTDQNMAEDGRWDARLGAILGQEGMVQIVQQALADQNTVIAQATPGQGGSTGNGRG